MKTKWRALLFVSFFVAVLVLSTCFVAAKADSHFELYKKAEEYARTTVFPILSGYIKDRTSTYTLGESFEMGGYDLSLVSASDAELYGWVFFMNNEANEPEYHFPIYYHPNLDFGFLGPLPAKGLNDAIILMKRLKKEAGLPETFSITGYGFHQYIVSGRFGSTEYAIVVDSSFSLDESYYNVESYLDLPTLQEIADIFIEEGKKVEEIVKETGQYPYGGSVVIKAHSPSERVDTDLPAVQPEDPAQPEDRHIPSGIPIPPDIDGSDLLQKDGAVTALPQAKTTPAEPVIDRIDNVQPILAAEPVQTADRQPLTGLIIAAAVFVVLLVGSGVTILLLHRKKASA